MQEQALKLINEIKAELDRLESHQFSPVDINILGQLKFQAERTIRWIKLTPEMMAMPKTIDAQELERQTHQLVGRRQPLIVGGKPID